ncbi:MAG: ABC transporter ATP-binding protein [Chloroflexota bacterium]|nr:MAG: ABC transporter ATP-binding protein [Chloroflexota bacterium]
MLRVNNIDAVYSRVIHVLKGVSLEVPEGKVVALLGANGAGKSTVLKAISGMLRIEDGAVTSGSVELDGQRIDGRGPEQIVAQGLVHVMEDRIVGQYFTVEENLALGSVLRHDHAAVLRDTDVVYEYFPKLAQLRKTKAGYLSGGEQQMLVLGRALMSRPKVLLLDEPSLGLAPLVVEEIFGVIERINREEGMTILLVEQNATVALSVAHYGYVLENGRVVLDGETASLKSDENVKEFYLGLSVDGARKSFRDAKHYSRRKRLVR